MPIEYRIATEAKRVDCTHVGAVSDDEFLRTCERLYGEPDFDGGFDILVDLIHAESSPRGAGALKMIADLGARHHGRGDRMPRIAIVAAADLSYGLARMYEGYATSVLANVRVFRAREQALAWMGEPREPA